MRKVKSKGILIVVKVKLATIVEGDPKDPLQIAPTPISRQGRNSIPRVAPLYPSSSPYNTECKQSGIKYQF